MLEFDHLFDTTLASLRKLLRRFVQENLATEGRGGGCVVKCLEEDRAGERYDVLWNSSRK